MMLLYYQESYILQSVIFNDMTELSATIRELIFESGKNDVAQISKLVCGEHKQNT